MTIPGPKVWIYLSEELEGLTGPNGERFCVFFRNDKDPLDSLWEWCQTEEEAVEEKAAWLQALKEVPP